MTLRKTLIITGGGVTSVTLPEDWNNNDNIVACLGAGGNGGDGSFDGAGGGAYSQETNLVLPIGYEIPCHAGHHDGDGNKDSWINGTTLATSSVGAKGGGNAAQPSGTNGGQASAGVGTLKYSGGNGGLSNSGTGGGGGGAAGPNGNGNNGVLEVGGSGDAGFGGAAGEDGAEFNDGFQGCGGGGNGGGANRTGYYGAGGGSGLNSSPGSHGTNGILIFIYTPIIFNHLTEYERSKIPGPVSGPIPY